MEEAKTPPDARRYPKEVRERAVRMFQEASAERGANQGSVTLIARKPGVGPERLQRWVRQAEIDGDIAR